MDASDLLDSMMTRLAGDEAEAACDAVPLETPHVRVRTRVGMVVTERGVEPLYVYDREETEPCRL